MTTIFISYLLCGPVSLARTTSCADTRGVEDMRAIDPLHVLYSGLKCASGWPHQDVAGT
jgi:hypothetical protein